MGSEGGDAVERYCDIVCRSFGEEARLSTMHLITLGHIPMSTIIRHVAYDMYPEKLIENRNHWGAIVDIAATLDVSERTIWGILNKQGIHKRKKA